MRWLAVAGAVAVVAIVTAVVMWRLFEATEDRTEVLSITAAAPGLSPGEVERLLVVPLEDAVRGLKNLREVRSESREGLGVLVVSVEREHEDEELLIAQAVSSAVRAVEPQLPDAARAPVVQRLESPRRITRHRYVLSAERWTAAELSRWARWEFRRSLEVQSGVRAVEFCGQTDEELLVTLDPVRLQATGVSAATVVQALQAASLDLPGGQLALGGHELVIRGGGKFRSLEDVADVPLSAAGTRVRDVAVLARAASEPECVAFLGGQRVVLAEVRTNLRLEKPLALPLLPPGVHVEPVPSLTSAFELVTPAGELAMKKGEELSRAGLTRVRKNVIELLQANGPGEEKLPELHGTPGVEVLRGPGVSVRWLGSDLEQLQRVAQAGQEKLRASKARWVGAAWPATTVPELELELDRQRGAPMSEVASLVRLLGPGQLVGELREGELRVDVRAVVSGGLQDGLSLLRLSDGRPLSDVATLEQRLAPERILRVNWRRAMELQVGGTTEEVRATLASLELPEGVVMTVEPTARP